MRTAVRVGDKVRNYTDCEDDWFWPGRVSAVDLETGTADIDYGDWVQRYPLQAIREAWPDDGSYERVLIPWEPGVTIEDYRFDEAV